MKVLVVGFGCIAKKHISNLRILYPQARLAVLCRPGKQRDTHELEQLFHDVESAKCWDPDFILIASPATLHEEHVAEFASLQIPILVEKPLASNLVEARKLQSVLKSRCMLGYQLRFTDGFRQLQEWLPQLGHLYFVRMEVGQYLPSWRPDTPVSEMVSANPELGGGVLLELSHELDMLSLLLGSPVRVYAAAGPASHLNLAVEESTELSLRYESGLLVQIHLDMLQYRPTRQSKWLGEFGQIEWDMLSNTLSWYDRQGNLFRQMVGQSTPQQVAQRQLTAFIEGLQEGASPTQGITTLMIVDAARKSIKSGCEVCVGE